MNPPIIIVGAPRSGTNMLRDVLVRIPGLVTWPCDEVPYLWKHGNRTVPHDELTPDQVTPQVVEYLGRAFGSIRRKQGGHTVVEKTCATSLRIGFAAAAVPDARFIFIRRDGLDAAASTAKRWNASFDLRYTARKARHVPASDVPFYAWGYLSSRVRKARTGSSERDVTSWWGPRPADYRQLQRQYQLPELAGVQWQRCVETSRRDVATLDPGRWLEVAYEDFVAEPGSQLGILLDFLGVNASANQVQDAVAPVRRTSVGKSGRTLDEETHRRLAVILQPTRAVLGYA